jgi:hypothetical protein
MTILFLIIIIINSQKKKNMTDCKTGLERYWTAVEILEIFYNFFFPNMTKIFEEQQKRDDFVFESV